MQKGCSACDGSNPDDKYGILRLLQYRYFNRTCCRGHTYRRAGNSISGEEHVETEIPVKRISVQQLNVPVQEEPAAEPTPAVDNSFSLEEQEYQVLLKIVEAEAGGEDTTGKMLVANVVMNRVRSSKFPNTVTEVVYQTLNGKAQFSPTEDGRIDRVKVSDDTVEAVARVMNGEDTSAGATFFRSVSSKSGWHDRKLTRILEHGNHIFYVM